MSDRSLSRRQVHALVLVGIIIGAVAVPVLAAVFSNPVPQSGTVPYETNSGATINLVGDVNTSSGNPFPDNQTVDIETSEGNATFSSTGDVNATVNATDLTGSWTVVSNLNVTQTDLTINPEDKRKTTVGGDIDRIEFRDPSLDDGNVDFVYAGSSGTSTVTVRGLQANASVKAVDADTGDTLDVSTSDSSGVVTLEGMPNSEHRVTLKNEESKSPVLTDPQPDGNVSTRPDTFSVHVEDDDFPGDNVTLEWYIEGSKFNETYATSDGRYNVTSPSLSNGLNDWSVIATDENGNRDVINATVGLPGTLYIRNETNASELVQDNVTVTVAFENGSVVEERTTTDGTVNLTGLVTTDFIVTAESNTSYYSRTVYFQSIIGDNSIYLLNTNHAAIESRFQLDDPTGNYPTTSLLIVKKAINRSGTKKYRTIYSDRFGVEGVTVDLEKEERYHIFVRNPQGDVQELGPYRSDTGETVTVRPGSPEIELGSYEEGWAANAELNNRTLEYRYDDPENSTQQVTIWIHEKGNTSNRLRPNVTYYDLGSVSGSYTLTENESEKTWVVNFIIEFDDGRQVTDEEEVAKKADLVPDLDREWRLIVAVLMMLISAGVFSILNAGVGGVVVSLEGGLLWYTGWLDGATSGIGVALGLMVAVIAHIYMGERV